MKLHRYTLKNRYILTYNFYGFNHTHAFDKAQICTHTLEWGRWGWWGWGCVCWWVVSSIRYPAPRSIPLHFSCRPPTNMGSANSYQQNGSLSIFLANGKFEGNLWHSAKRSSGNRISLWGMHNAVNRITWGGIVSELHFHLISRYETSNNHNFEISLWNYKG